MNIPNNVKNQIPGANKVSNQNYKGNNKNTGGYKPSGASLTPEYRKDVLDGYYRDGSIKKEFILDHAEGVANIFMGEKVTTTQLRSFYDTVKQVETKVDTHKSQSFESLMVNIWGLEPIAASKVTKGTLPKVFEDFIKLNVDHIKNKDDIKAFEKHFKSIVCYMKK